MQLKVFCIISMLFGYAIANDSRFCLWSKKTAAEIESCPKSKREIEERAKAKDCDSTAKLQNCTKPEQFKYHCLINEFENAFIEVCAPYYYILSGYCAEYNTLGALIQQHIGLKCNVEEPPCKSRYISTDAYHYKVCYEAVSRKKSTSLIPVTTVPYNISLSSVMPKLKYSRNGIDDGILATIVCLVVAVVIGLIVAVTVAFLKYRKISFSTIFGCGNSDEDEELVELNPAQRKLEHKGQGNQGNCKEEYYKDALKGAEELRSLMNLKENELENNADTNEDTQITEDQGSTDAFLEAYSNVGETFVETTFSKKCSEILQKNKIAIIIGKQGCGKTLTAIHIINNDYYRDWKKQKIVSFNDLLAMKVDEAPKLLVYIDNILDGFIFYEMVRNWWYSICYFFFRHVKKSENVHLLITAKEDVVEEAFEHINADEFSIDNPCLVREGAYCLSAEEKIKILESQFKFAKTKLKEYSPSCAKTLFNEEIKDKRSSSIGFPLCAHLYAFDNTITKTTNVFEYPRDYVIQHIDSEIANDKTNAVKTLFLVLLFYHTQSESRLDIRHEEDSREFLENAVSKAFVGSMEPLLFKNLFETAMRLEDIILVKNANMFEFKHQIYLEGVSDYFFRHPVYSQVAVQHFPLDILRPYDFPGASDNILGEITQRFKKEILEGMQAVLSCKVFKKSEFERQFCEELKKDNMLQRLLFNPSEKVKGLRFTFWTSKYHLPNLSHAAWMAVHNINLRSDHLFYQARLGECCEIDKRYAAKTSSSTTGLDNAEQLVWDFRVHTGESILHIILRSEMPDYEANDILLKLLNDAAKQKNLIFSGLLKCTMEQKSYSRILCLLSLLHRENVANEKVSIQSIVEKIKSSDTNDAHFELEFLVRICILYAHGAVRKTCFKLPSIDQKFRYLRELFHESKTQHTMSLIMRRCLSQCQKTTPTESSGSPDFKCTTGTCKCKLSPGFEKAIEDAVQVQTRRGNLSNA